MSQTATGLYKLTMYLRPDQYLFLRAEALKTVMDRGGGRPDVSVILREMIDKIRDEMDAGSGRSKRKRK